MIILNAGKYMDTCMLLGIINWYKVYEKKFDNRDQEHFRSYTPWQVISLLRIHSKKITRDVFNNFCIVFLQNPGESCYTDRETHKMKYSIVAEEIIILNWHWEMCVNRQRKTLNENNND